MLGGRCRDARAMRKGPAMRTLYLLSGTLGLGLVATAGLQAPPGRAAAQMILGIAITLWACVMQDEHRRRG